MLRIGQPGQPPSPTVAPPQGGGNAPPDPAILQQLLAGAGGGGGDQPPAGDPEAVDIKPLKKYTAEKVAQQLAGYMGPEAGPFQCQHCDFFDNNSCSIVAGDIDPEGCCNNFTPQGVAGAGGGDEGSPDEEAGESPDDEAAEGEPQGDDEGQ